MICWPGDKPRTCESACCVKPCTNPNVGEVIEPTFLAKSTMFTAGMALADGCGMGAGTPVPPPPPPPQPAAVAAAIASEAITARATFEDGNIIKILLRSGARKRAALVMRIGLVDESVVKRADEKGRRHAVLYHYRRAGLRT